MPRRSQESRRNGRSGWWRYVGHVGIVGKAGFVTMVSPKIHWFVTIFPHFPHWNYKCSIFVLYFLNFSQMFSTCSPSTLPCSQVFLYFSSIFPAEMAVSFTCAQDLHILHHISILYIYVCILFLYIYIHIYFYILYIYTHIYISHVCLDSIWPIERLLVPQISEGFLWAPGSICCSCWSRAPSRMNRCESTCAQCSRHRPKRWSF